MKRTSVEGLFQVARMFSVMSILTQTGATEAAKKAILREHLRAVARRAKQDMPRLARLIPSLS